MKRISTAFLQTVIVLIGIVALIILIWFPLTEGRATHLDLFSTYADPFILYGYGASMAFFVALYNAFRLLGYIGQNKVFSTNSVKNLKNIKHCAILLSILIVVAYRRWPRRFSCHLYRNYFCRYRSCDSRGCIWKIIAKCDRYEIREWLNSLIMPIIVNLDVMMVKRKISLNELSERVGLTLSNLSILKTGKAKAIRFSTLEAICRALDCQPSDILEYVNDEKKTT